MVPTVRWMRDKFAIYNRQYFGGQLPTPEFAVENLGKEWGKYDLDASYYKGTREVYNIKDNGRITLTGSYSRKENAVICSLLHEMIHEYVYLVLRVYPKDKHGQEFMSVANRMIADGWNIEEVTFMTKDDTEPGPKTPSVILVISKPGGKDFKYWVCRVDPKDIPQFENTVSKIPNLGAHEFYQLNGPHCDCLNDAQSDPVGLTGWHGMTFDEVLGEMSLFSGINKEELRSFSIYYPNQTQTP